jgi:flagellar motor switch protein FliM
MSETLSPDKIAALVEAAKQGQLPDPTSHTGQRRARRLRTVDFSRPTKFSSDQQRRIVRAIETFCQTAITRLSTELRWPVELELLNTLQLTWSAAQAQLPSSSVSVIVEVAPIGTRMLLTAEQSFVLVCLECLLGGSPDRPPRDRRLSEIDWSLTRRLFESIVGQLSMVWQELGGVTLTAGEIELHDTSPVASVSEPTFTILIECRMNKQSFALGLLIPWIAIEPVAAHISGADELQQDDDPAGMPAMVHAMSGVPITLRAEVADVDLAVADILALAPGSIVRFGRRLGEGVNLFAENVKLAGASPGASGARRAVQIHRTDGESL